LRRRAAGATAGGRGLARFFDELDKQAAQRRLPGLPLLLRVGRRAAPQITKGAGPQFVRELLA
jgi:hypothetical protein